MLIEVGDENIRALARECDSDRPADARVGPGDQSDTPLQALVTAVRVLAVIRYGLSWAVLPGIAVVAREMAAGDRPSVDPLA